MKAVVGKLRDNQYALESMGTTKVSGRVEAEDDSLLYTSIPYYRGFKVYVDGEKKELVSIAGAMCGVEVSAGEHEIVFRYFPYGLKTGIALSFAGLILLYIYWRKFSMTVCPPTP